MIASAVVPRTNVSKITPQLLRAYRIALWTVNTRSIDKILRILSSGRILQYAILGIVFNGVSSVLAARAIGPLQFSAFASAIAIITTLQILLQGLQFSSHAVFAQKNQESSNTNLELKRFIKEGVSLTLIFTILIFLSKSYLNVTSFQVIAIALMVFPGLAFASISGYYLWSNDLVGYQKIATLNSGFRICLSLILYLIASVFELLKSPAMFIAILVAANYLTLLVVRKKAPKYVFIQSRILNRESAYAVTIVSIGWLLIQGDLILFHSALAANEAGKIAAYSSVAKVFISLIGLLGLVIATRFKEEMSRKLMIKAFGLLCTVTVFIALTGLFIGKSFIIVVFGESYEIENSYLPILVLSNSMWAIFLGLLNIQLKSSISAKLAFALIVITLGAMSFSLLNEMTLESIQKLSFFTALGGVATLIFLQQKNLKSSISKGTK